MLSANWICSFIYFFYELYFIIISTILIRSWGPSPGLFAKLSSIHRICIKVQWHAFLYIIMCVRAIKKKKKEKKGITFANIVIRQPVREVFFEFLLKKSICMFLFYFLHMYLYQTVDRNLISLVLYQLLRYVFFRCLIYYYR